MATPRTKRGRAETSPLATLKPDTLPDRYIAHCIGNCMMPDVNDGAPILVDEYTAWCEKRGEEPEDARAAYAADRFAAGDAITWPPARNAAGEGPIHVSPAASTASANSALSARKP